MALEHLSQVGAQYEATRGSLLNKTGVGVTTAYRMMHNASAMDGSGMRDAHVALDRAVVAAYGWDDQIEKLQHDFYPTNQGERFTIHPDARKEVLARLLALNHERYAEEVAAGLHDEKSKSKAKKMAAKQASKKTKAAGESGLFKGSAE